jgi:hypothetical protein
LIKSETHIEEQASRGQGWDAAVTHLGSPGPLLQSYGYGQVQAREGWSVENVLLPSGARALVLLRGLGRLRTAYVPRGPVPAGPEAVAELAAWASDRRLARLRIEPEAASVFGEQLRSLGWRPARAFHPQHTRIVRLGTDEEMLAGFKPKHRYNVRLAEKRGVTVDVGGDAGELWRQSRGTEQRQEISLPSESQYRRRLDCLSDCRTYVARHEGEALAAIMVARFGGRAYYLFGGSAGSKRQLMPTYAVQWAAMQDAARSGCRDYDLWGVPPSEADTDHPWHGLWQFKAGFGGEVVEYCGAWDLILRPWAAQLDATAGGARRLARRLRR